MYRSFVLAAVAVSLSACASSGPPPRRGPPGGPPGGPSAVSVFISPAGEPFRAQPGGRAPMQAWFDQADADRNGGIERAEFVADHMRFFKLLDVNGDGYIAGPETTRYEEQIAPELLSAIDRGLEAGPGGVRRGGPPGGGRGGGRRGGGPRLNLQGDDGPIRLPQPEADRERAPGGGPGGRMRGNLVSLLGEPEPVRAADADVDFRVTVAEWNAIANQRFDRLDPDHDGHILFSELRPQAETAGRPGGGRVAPRGGGR